MRQLQRQRGTLAIDEVGRCASTDNDGGVGSDGLDDGDTGDDDNAGDWRFASDGDIEPGRPRFQWNSSSGRCTNSDVISKRGSLSFSRHGPVQP